MCKEKVVFISWAPYCSRSDNIARELGGKSYMVYYAFLGSNYYTIGFKYLFQTVKSLKILLIERPDVVFCMSPPIFTALPAWIYCKIAKKIGYVVDYHTAAFVKPIYKKLYFVQKFFAKRAITNIVTNEYLANIIKSWQADFIIIADVQVDFADISEFKNFRSGFNIVFVSSFSEPLDVVFQVAHQLEKHGVNIYVTGDLKDAKQEMLKKSPKNVYFTDFLSYPLYAGLLKCSDAILCLCTQDHTMQRGAYEAMALEKPIIISNWKLLKDTFYKGAIYVDNTVEGITKGILAMKDNIEKYHKDIKELKKERIDIWNKNKGHLMNKITGSVAKNRDLMSDN